jgi:hypothetical protein
MYDEMKMDLFGGEKMRKMHTHIYIYIYETIKKKKQEQRTPTHTVWSSDNETMLVRESIIPKNQKTRTL